MNKAGFSAEIRQRTLNIEDLLEASAEITEALRFDAREDEQWQGVIALVQRAGTWMAAAAREFPGGDRALELLRTAFVGAGTARELDARHDQLLASAEKRLLAVAGRLDGARQ